ncbi:neutral zinc metallopeptidase, partial [Mycobacterium tuberculosis]|nr:neutral zinc metallopeptidase [Mycobacterium tuberculosis]
AMQTGSAITGGNSSGQQTLDQQTADRDQKFVSVVLKDTEEVWGQIFSENNMQYQQPKLVLFNGMVRSGCGNASSATGPFYCPADQR